MLQRLIITFVIIAGFSAMGCESSDESPMDENTDGRDGSDGTDNVFETDSFDITTDSDTSEIENTELFPHAVGNYWTYLYEYSGAIGSCAEGEWTARMTEMSELDDVETYTYLNPCVTGAEQIEFPLQFDGDRVLLVGYDTPYVMLDAPVTDGYEWQTLLDVTEFTYSWQSVATVTVDAGTFNDCWKRIDMNSGAYLTYCRGVGRVEAGTGNVPYSKLIDYHLETE